MTSPGVLRLAFHGRADTRRGLIAWRLHAEDVIWSAGLGPSRHYRGGHDQPGRTPAESCAP